MRNFLDREFRISLAPAACLAVVTLWCHALYHVHPMFATWPAALVFLAYLGFVAWLYRDVRLRFSVHGTELAFFTAALAGLTALHGPYLTYSLGGDELYHAERSAFPLWALRAHVEAMPALPIEEYRRSLWNLFDLRHMAVVDVWRVLALLLLGAGALLWAAQRALGRAMPAARAVLLVVIVVFLFAWGRLHAVGSDLHPPFRLFPVFLSQLALGWNAFAFRWVGVIVAAAVSTLFFALLSRDSERPLPWAWRALVSFSIAFVPAVYYASEAVEPSIYGYAAWTSALLLGWRYLRKPQPQLLIALGLLVGIASITRQTTVALWSLVGALSLAHVAREKRIDWKLAARVFVPGLVAVPYFYMIKRFGHFLLQSDTMTTGEKLAASLSSGTAVMTALNTTTLPWAILLGLMLVYGVRKIRWPEAALFAVAAPAYVVFFTVWSYLWGLGRYQAEYVAPFALLGVFYFARACAPRLRVPAALALVFLMGVTVELNSNLSLDVNYQEWPRMRVSSSASFPYREALGYLKRQEAGGSFVLIGGQPWYGDAVLWFSGHSFSETRRWHELQDAANAFWESRPTEPQLREFLKTRGIRFLAVQSGTRREAQHQSAATRHVLGLIEPLAPAWLPRKLDFTGEHGGILSVYQVL